MEETYTTDKHFNLINDHTGHEFVIAAKDYVKICKEHNVTSFKDIPDVFIDCIVQLSERGAAAACQVEIDSSTTNQENPAKLL